MNVLGLEISLRERPTPAHLMASAESERRAAGESLSSTSPNLARDVFSMSPAAAGYSVSEEASLSIGAVYACVRVLSESVASLPLKLYRRSGRNREAADGHPLYRVLHHAGNPLMTAFVLREVMMVHLCLWGNVYAEKQMNGRGDVIGLWPIHPSRVTPSLKATPAGPVKQFKIDRPNDTPLVLGSEEVLHIPGLGFDGLVGKSPIRLMREALSVARAAERYGAKFFSNDARPGSVLTHPGKLSDEGFGNLKASWKDAHQGTDNAFKVAILEEGMDIKTVGLPPEDAQFIETRKYQRGEVASIYRVQPHLIGDLDKATYSNIEHQGIEFVMHTLRPWLVRIEQGLTTGLLTPEEEKEYFIEHTVDGLLRGDAKSRFEAYAQGRQWGYLSANDIRELENLNPIDAGNIYLQPLNMVPAGTDPTADSNDDQRSLERRSERRALPPRYHAGQALQPVFADAFRRIVKRETTEIRRAVTRYLAAGDASGFADWLGSFVDEHAAWMEPRLRPLFDGMAEAMVRSVQDEIGEGVSADDLGDFVTRYTAAYAGRHTGSTRGQLEALLEETDPATAVGTRLDEWDETRAEKDARRERQRSSNAITKAAWLLIGVRAVTWRNTGTETCPYCESLAGKRSSITSYFLNAGESIQDLTVRTAIGHPPLHDGCDCILMPDLGSRSVPGQLELRAALDALIGEHHG